MHCQEPAAARDDSGASSDSVLHVPDYGIENGNKPEKT
jgi:hypothetical protein